VKKIKLLIFVLILLFNSNLKGQNNAPPLPQRTVSLNLEMPLNFGDFIIVDNQSAWVSINSDGIETYNNVVVLNSYESPHRAELSFHLCPGRSLSLSWQPTFTMNSNGSGTPVTVQLNDVKVGTTPLTNGQSFNSNKGCQDTHYIYMGGKLILNAATNYQGIYTGNFWVTVNYQ
jgi:hypothetical protein